MDKNTKLMYCFCFSNEPKNGIFNVKKMSLIYFFFTLLATSGPICSKKFQKMFILAFQANNAINGTFFRILAYQLCDPKLHHNITKLKEYFLVSFLKNKSKQAKISYLLGKTYVTQWLFKELISFLMNQAQST